MNHRFKIGDRVQVIGVLADFYLGKTGTVIAIVPNENGVLELDRYGINIADVDVSDTMFADFQLAPAPGLEQWRHE